MRLSGRCVMWCKKCGSFKACGWVTPVMVNGEAYTPKPKEPHLCKKCGNKVSETWDDDLDYRNALMSIPPTRQQDVKVTIKLPKDKEIPDDV